MGVVVGLTFGLGLLLVWRSASTGPRTRKPRAGWLQELLAAAALSGVQPAVLCGASAGLAIGSFTLMYLLSGALPVAAILALLASYAPVAYLRGRVARRRAASRQLWPDVVDNLTSAVRAGLSLPEAVAQLGERGPAELRAPFASFGEDFRSTGRFSESLDRLKDRLADPVGDRIVETLRVTRDVGGSDLGTVLRTLSAFLREDARVRSELEARQSWTVNGARLAVAATWLVLVMMSFNPQAVAAYNSRAGLVVLAGGAVACVLAYRAMLRIGRLPEEERVLR